MKRNAVDQESHDRMMRAKAVTSFMKKWLAASTDGDLMTELLAVVALARDHGQDEVEAILSNTMLASAIRMDPGLARVLTTELPLVIDAVKVMNRMTAAGTNKLH